MFKDLFSHIDRMFRELETAFEDAEPREVRLGLSSNGYHVEKGKGQVTIRVEVPGCTHKDVQLGLTDGMLMVTANSTSMVQSRTHQFRVGRKIDVGDIKATVKDGMMTIYMKSDTQPASPKGTVPVSQG